MNNVGVNNHKKMVLKTEPILIHLIKKSENFYVNLIQKQKWKFLCEFNPKIKVKIKF